MVDEARKYLESDEGQAFESGLQQEFVKDKQNTGVISQDNEQGDLTSTGRDNAGQSQDSRSGMNTGTETSSQHLGSFRDLNEFMRTASSGGLDTHESALLLARKS
jgi:hypothetical protein